ncbi:putative toxin-antitoxin system toxin component, PIN family [Chitinispirillales bacterium ANBcel5]|uniref:putative toxin-antitoxin system toxin component, PIN family n=1 Tax=Cellulosispirillum alkaliphilum TaxID=3039283 RepID=UPI002A547242|nr:putative toxin-antitoxin system toxin component, PIN family [Chitinispirillales bacterium ANBcel5]
MKIVLDTNVLVSGIFWGGIPFKILEHWMQNRFELIISREILDEYQRTLIKISKGKNDTLVDQWMLLITEFSHIINTKRRFRLSADPDDDKFIECAVAGSAKYIVSGDSHLLDIGTVLDIPIMPPSEFLKKI